MWKYLRITLVALMLVGIGVYVSEIPASALDMYPTSINITLYVTPLLLPVITNDGGASNIAATTARLNGEVTDTGNENPSVIVFYGTSDGGTNPVSWSENTSLGVKALGEFYYDATGLLPTTTYYYRMYAFNAAGDTWALSSANFTTTILFNPPSGFTVTDLGCVTVSMNWTRGAGATYTLIRGKRNDYPENITEGELIYYGDAESANSTGYALETTPYMFTAWSFLSDNVTYSTAYETATIGGAGMTGIATSISDINGTLVLFHDCLLLLPLLAFSILAFWKENPIMFMITAAIAFMTGLNAPDILNGQYNTTTIGVTVGIMLIIYALCCMGWSIKLMFWKGEEGE